MILQSNTTQVWKLNQDNNCCLWTMLKYNTHLLHKQNSSKKKRKTPQNKTKHSKHYTCSTQAVWKAKLGQEWHASLSAAQCKAGQGTLCCSRANRIGTLKGPGRRLASFGRGAGGSSTDGGGGPECCPERASCGYLGLWRSAGAAGLPAVPPAALRKKRQSVEEQGGGWEWVDNGHDKTVWRRDWS